MTVAVCLLALLSVLGVGGILLATIGPGVLLGSPARTALAFVLGSGTLSCLLFGLLWAGVGLPAAARILCATGLVFGVVLLARQKPRPVPRPDPERLSLPVVLLGLVVLAGIALAFSGAVLRPLSAWDAWVNWASKARVLHVEGTLVPALHADPARLPTNLDYPLHLPLLQAYAFTLLGGTDHRVAAAIPVLHHAALLGLLFAAVRRRAGRVAATGAAALLAATPLVEWLVPAGLAEPLVAAEALGALLLVVLAMEVDEPRPRDVFLAGLAAGFLPWTKNEGFLWLALVGAGFASALLRCRRLRPGRVRALRLASAFTLPALVPGSAWQLFLLSRGTVRYVYAAPARLSESLERIPEILLVAARHLASPGWGFVWPAVLAVILVRGRASLRAPDGSLVLVPLGFLALVCASFLFTRFDPWLPHVVNSVDRLAFQAFPVAVWWLAVQGAVVLESERSGTRSSSIRP